MVEHRIYLCDYNGCTRPRAKDSPWRISDNKEYVELDLCQDHAADLRVYMGFGKVQIRRPGERMSPKDQIPVARLIEVAKQNKGGQ